MRIHYLLLALAYAHAVPTQAQDAWGEYVQQQGRVNDAAQDMMIDILMKGQGNQPAPKPKAEPAVATRGGEAITASDCKFVISHVEMFGRYSRKERRELWDSKVRRWPQEPLLVYGKPYLYQQADRSKITGEDLQAERQRCAQAVGKPIKQFAELMGVGTPLKAAAVAPTTSLAESQVAPDSNIPVEQPIDQARSPAVPQVSTVNDEELPPPKTKAQLGMGPLRQSDCKLYGESIGWMPENSYEDNLVFIDDSEGEFGEPSYTYAVPYLKHMAKVVSKMNEVDVQLLVTSEVERCLKITKGKRIKDVSDLMLGKS